MAVKLIGGEHSIGQVAEALDVEINDGVNLWWSKTKYLSCRYSQKPDLYLLDEPTSAMDAECEQAFLSCLRGKLNDKALSLTHKPSILSAGGVIVCSREDRMMGLLLNTNAWSCRRSGRNAFGRKQIGHLAHAVLAGAFLYWANITSLDLVTRARTCDCGK